MLQIEKVTKKFGEFVALNECTFNVQEGEIVGLIGPNGAGKTTIINTISGVHRSNGGTITYLGKEIQNKPPHAITQRGIGRTFQITKIFRGITVYENMLTAGMALNTDKDAVVRKAHETLEMLEITSMAEEPAWTLSVGQQKLLEIGMKLMLDPDLMILDEPFHGIHPRLVEKILETIRILRDDGKTFLIVSHDLHSVAAICTRVIALNFGEVIAEGTPDEIRNNKQVIDIYLGA
ncbi:MAG: ABC transporter ATP-binding protein [Candidatus Thorarchaeota archaeon]